MIADYDLYSNVNSIENFLTNIKTTALTNGWVLDSDAISSTGELYIHSLGEYNNQLLYFSFKIVTASDDATKKRLLWHCNTGYSSGSAWDAQPGKYSVIPDYVENSSFYSEWECNAVAQYPQGSNSSFWVVPVVEKQYVFACDQFIMCVQKVIQVDSSGSTFSGWCAMFVGAADSLIPTTEDSLGLTMTSSWHRNGYIGSIFLPYMKLPYYSSYNYQYVNAGYTKTPFGFDYDGTAMFDLPPYLGTQGYGTGVPTKFIVTSVPLIAGRQTSAYNSYTQKQYRSTYYYTAGNDGRRNSIYSPCYAGSILKNKSSATLTMVKPIIFNYKNVSGTIYFYPTRASLPYYATRLNPYHQAEDVITIGSRNFMLFPLFDVNDYFGFGIEVA